LQDFRYYRGEGVELLGHRVEERQELTTRFWTENKLDVPVRPFPKLCGNESCIPEKLLGPLRMLRPDDQDRAGGHG
jgi:hypothetical protein